MMKEKILELLDRLEISYRWVDHPAVFTVAESVKHIEDKRPIKNLLLQEKGEGRKILVIMAGEEKLDVKALASQLGTKKLRFATPEVMLETLGVTPGAVSIFGLLHLGSEGVEVVIDQSLLTEPELGFHPNDNTATIFLPGSSLKKILSAQGHPFLLLEL